MDVAAAVLKLSGGALRHPLGNTARSARLRRATRALRHQRQRCRGNGLAQPDPLARDGRGADRPHPLWRLHAAIPPGLRRRARGIRRGSTGRRSQRLYVARRTRRAAASRSPQTARDSNGGPSQSTRSPRTPVTGGLTPSPFRPDTEETDGHAGARDGNGDERGVGRALAPRPVRLGRGSGRRAERVRRRGHRVGCLHRHDDEGAPSSPTATPGRSGRSSRRAWTRPRRT